MRQFGLLLHISSLPSAYGIGDLGPAAHAFARTLGEAGASIWQFLPVNPTSTFIGNSPYSSPSAFAGNPLFISPEFLVRDGYLSFADVDCSTCCLIDGRVCSDPAQVDFAAVSAHREHLLSATYERNCHKLHEHTDFQAFCREHAYWLHDYARFVSIKAEQGGASWVTWPKGLCMRDPDALAAWDAHAEHAIQREKFIQYLFFSQWQSLRETCAEAGVSLLADIPLYVTHDSVDVWTNPQFFNLNAEMQPITVSGVPPDYFSATGQRWGTPVYKWDVMQQDDFGWWKRRLGHTLLVADMVRLDHFRGFCGYWEIPAEEETAINGKWKRAPVTELFTSLQKHFNGLPFIAEDLGIITSDVCQCMQDFELPGMHVLQFAFGGGDIAHNPDIPHAYTPFSVVYSGTHDNAPTRSWFNSTDQSVRDNLAAYVGVSVTAENVTPLLTRMAFASVASTAIIPVQDALNLGDEARMNIPGIAAGNWAWRMTEDQARPEHFMWLKALAHIYGRLKPAEGDSEPEYAPY